jgi:colanic acid biosynthesis glycosyl transferase WcaI
VGIFMNILFVSDYFPPERNAAATRVYERAIHWLRWGHRMTVVTNAPNFPEGKVFPGYRNVWRRVETVDGLRVVRVKSFIAANRGVALRLVDFLSFFCTSLFFGMFETRPDLVTATSPQFFAGVSGALLSIWHRRPFVLEIGDLWPASAVGVGIMKRSLALRFAEAMELWMYRRATKIIALSHRIGEDLVGRGVPREKIVVATNGVDLHRYGPRPKDEALLDELALRGKFVAAYIGTHGMAHALERVVEAAALLRDRDDIRFLFVGAGAARDGVIAHAERLGLKNVVFVREVPKEQIARYWSLCDVALVHLKNSPVFATAIPSKIFEAMGMGLPMIISAPPGDALDIVQREDVGLIVPPEDPRALADAVLQLQGDGALRARLATKSHGAAPSYTREAQARIVIGTYEAAQAEAAAR